jgi:hypothetical protein
MTKTVFTWIDSYDEPQRLVRKDLDAYERKDIIMSIVTEMLACRRTIKQTCFTAITHGKNYNAYTFFNTFDGGLITILLHNQ